MRAATPSRSSADTPQVRASTSQVSEVAAGPRTGFLLVNTSSVDEFADFLDEPYQRGLLASPDGVRELGLGLLCRLGRLSSTFRICAA